MSNRQEQGDDDRLKTELRRLKRAGAPWYFESELHQRLHGGPPRRTRLRPYGSAPAIALSLIVFCSIVIAAYVVVLKVIFFPQGSNEGENGTPAIRLPEASPAISLPKTEKLETPILARTPLRSAGGGGMSVDSSIRGFAEGVTADQPGDSALTRPPAGGSEVPLVVHRAATQADSAQIIYARDTLISPQDTLSLPRDSVPVPRPHAPNR